MKNNKNLFTKLNSNLNINYCNKILYKSNYKKNKNLFLKLNSNLNINYCNKILYKSNYKEE
jgi:hypothetical protein